MRAQSIETTDRGRNQGIEAAKTLNGLKWEHWRWRRCHDGEQHSSSIRTSREYHVVIDMTIDTQLVQSRYLGF